MQNPANGFPARPLACLDVDDEDTVVVENEQVRLAGEGGGVTAELEGVLAFEADVVAAPGPLVSLLVEQFGMAGEPVSLVEVGRLTVLALVTGFEPDGPFAEAFPGQEAGEPGGPDVGEVSSLRHDTAPWGGIAVVGLAGV